MKRWGGRCICIITLFPERRSQPTWTSRRSQRKITFWRKKIVVNSKSHQNHSTTGFLSDLFPLFINKLATRQVREPSWIKTGPFSSSWHSPPCSWSDSYPPSSQLTFCCCCFCCCCCYCFWRWWHRIVMFSFGDIIVGDEPESSWEILALTTPTIYNTQWDAPAMFYNV